MMPCDACTHDFDRHHAGSGLCGECDCAGFIADVPAEDPEE